MRYPAAVVAAVGTSGKRPGVKLLFVGVEVLDLDHFREITLSVTALDVNYQIDQIADFSLNGPVRQIDAGLQA